MKLETGTPATRNVRLAPEARPWQSELVSKLLPDYVEPGLLFEDWILEHLAQARVWIDAGCGDNFEVLQRETYRGLSVGLDYHFQLLKKYLAADIYHMPFGDGKADLVTSRWVVEHLARPAQALREVARVLRPGGALLVRTTNRLHYTSWLSRLLPMGLKQRIAGKQELHHTHYRLNDRRQFRRLAESVPGLRLERIRYIENLHYHSAPGFVLSALAERSLTALGMEWLKSSVLLIMRKK